MDWIFKLDSWIEKTWLGQLMTLIFARSKEEVIQHPMNQDTPSIPTVNPPPAYLWDTPENARHSVRVICDEEGLTVEQKNTLCATVGGESGWIPTAVGKPNTDGSRDWGICQVNDKIWIGSGKLFPSTDYVLANPEKCIRWMCGCWKRGKQNWWIAYKNGSYKKYL